MGFIIIYSGQIARTSAEVTMNGGLVREGPPKILYLFAQIITYYINHYLGNIFVASHLFQPRGVKQLVFFKFLTFISGKKPAERKQ